MFRHRLAPSETAALEDESLRDEPDPDPLVEAAAQRLREELSGLHPVDKWGRPMAWRQVARIALSSLGTPRVRDALTADVIADAVHAQRSVSPDVSDEQWKTFFRGLESSDRLLPKEPRPQPE